MKISNILKFAKETSAFLKNNYSLLKLTSY